MKVQTLSCYTHKINKFLPAYHAYSFALAWNGEKQQTPLAVAGRPATSAALPRVLIFVSSFLGR